MTNDMAMYVHCGTQGARDAIEAPAAPSRRRDSHSLACACSPLSPLPRSLPPSLAAHPLAAHSLTLVASLARGSRANAHCLTRSRSLPHLLAASLARSITLAAVDGRHRLLVWRWLGKGRARSSRTQSAALLMPSPVNAGRRIGSRMLSARATKLAASRCDGLGAGPMERPARVSPPAASLDAERAACRLELWPQFGGRARKLGRRTDDHDSACS